MSQYCNHNAYHSCWGRRVLNICCILLLSFYVKNILAFLFFFKYTKKVCENFNCFKKMPYLCKKYEIIHNKISVL